MDGSLPIDGLMQLFVTKGKAYNSRAGQKQETELRWIVPIPISDMTSLENLGEFENQSPSTFRAMYQFWAYKPS